MVNKCITWCADKLFIMTVLHNLTSDTAKSQTMGLFSIHLVLWSVSYIGFIVQIRSFTSWFFIVAPQSLVCLLICGLFVTSHTQLACVKNCISCNREGTCLECDDGFAKVTFPKRSKTVCVPCSKRGKKTALNPDMSKCPPGERGCFSWSAALCCQSW